MYTVPKVVNSDDLNKRAYVTFYLNSKRVREYNGNSLCLEIYPNLSKSIEDRKQQLLKLQFELHKALESEEYPRTNLKVEEPVHSVVTSNENKSVLRLLFEAVRRKLRTDLSRTYKRDLKSIYRQFRDFMLPQESAGAITNIATERIEVFLSRYGSSGTYYMNKRRNLSILFNAAGRMIDQPIKAVKETQRRKCKAKLHVAYEKEQLKPIFAYLKAHYPNLYVCCMLTYFSWLRPHEEIRLLTRGDFKNELTEVHLSGGSNKGGKVRVVYIPDYVRNEITSILNQLARTDNILSLRPEPFNEYYFNTQWSRAWKKMNELELIHEHQTIYSFRHTAAISLYRRTKDVYLLQKLLGHSSILVTLKYLRSLGELNTQELIDAAPTLD